MKKKKLGKSRTGIARSWTTRTASLMGIVLFLVVVSLAFMVQYFTYENIEQELRGHARELARLSDGIATQDEESFLAFATEYAVSTEDDMALRIAVLDNEGDVQVVSSGKADDYAAGNDFQKAQDSEDGIGQWNGTLPDGSHVMVVTKVIRDNTDRLLGGVRYCIPLDGASRTVLWATLIMAAVAVVFLLVVVVVSNLFVRRMIAPLKEINFSASKIAQGDFNIRLERNKADEIGELCDAINDMAISLDTTENMKNEFISSVSHELRTPLTAIKGWAETMQGGEGEIDHQTFDRGMSVIIRESERLSGIVEELLDFSRMQSGKMKTNMEKTDILKELDEAVYMFSDRAKAEHKFLLYEDPRSLSPIYGDINRLRQVFVNILDNALKYTDEGGTINVSAKERDGFIYVTVADNGCGIPEEHLPNVRRKFYKANQTIRGSGIGLALADEIMALHAGGLDIESHENLGTAVTISIPTYDNLQKQKEKMQR